jgi:hypothetical protein
MNSMLWYIYLLTWFPGVPIPQVEMASGFADKEQCEAHAAVIRLHRASIRDHNAYEVFCHQIPPMP